MKTSSAADVDAAVAAQARAQEADDRALRLAAAADTADAAEASAYTTYRDAVTDAEFARAATNIARTDANWVIASAKD